MEKTFKIFLVLAIPIFYSWSSSVQQTQTNIKPDEAEALYNLGTSYYKQGSYEDAVDAFKQAIRIKPDYAEAYYNLGLAYQDYPYDKLPKNKTKKYAIEAYKQAIRIKPDFVNAYINLGNTFWWLGRTKKAINAYKQAIRIRPDSDIAHYNLAHSYVELGDEKSALAELKILKGLDPSGAEQILRLMNDPLRKLQHRRSSFIQFLGNYKYYFLAAAFILCVVAFTAIKNRRRNKHTAGNN